MNSSPRDSLPALATQGLEYYTGKTELFDWANDLLSFTLTRLEQFASGAVFCQIVDAYHSNTVAIRKVNFAATTDLDILPNFKVLQAAFTCLNITKEVDVQKIGKASIAESLELLQWLYKEYAGRPPLKGYDPIARRVASLKGNVDTIPLPAFFASGFDVYARGDGGSTPGSLGADERGSSARTRGAQGSTGGSRPYTPSTGSMPRRNVSSRFRDGMAVPYDSATRASKAEATLLVNSPRRSIRMTSAQTDFPEDLPQNGHASTEGYTFTELQGNNVGAEAASSSASTPTARDRSSVATVTSALDFSDAAVEARTHTQSIGVGGDESSFPGFRNTGSIPTQARQHGADAAADGDAGFASPSGADVAMEGSLWVSSPTQGIPSAGNDAMASPHSDMASQARASHQTDAGSQHGDGLHADAATQAMQAASIEDDSNETDGLGTSAAGASSIGDASDAAVAVTHSSGQDMALIADAGEDAEPHGLSEPAAAAGAEAVSFAWDHSMDAASKADEAHVLSAAAAFVSSGTAVECVLSMAEAHGLPVDADADVEDASSAALCSPASVPVQAAAAAPGGQAERSGVSASTPEPLNEKAVEETLDTAALALLAMNSASSASPSGAHVTSNSATALSAGLEPATSTTLSSSPLAASANAYAAVPAASTPAAAASQAPETNLPDSLPAIRTASAASTSGASHAAAAVDTGAIAGAAGLANKATASSPAVGARAAAIAVEGESPTSVTQMMAADAASLIMLGGSPRLPALRLISASGREHLATALEVAKQAVNIVRSGVGSLTELSSERLSTSAAAGKGMDKEQDEEQVPAATASTALGCSCAFSGKLRSLQDATRTLLSHAHVLLTDIASYAGSASAAEDAVALAGSLSPSPVPSPRTGTPPSVLGARSTIPGTPVGRRMSSTMSAVSDAGVAMQAMVEEANELSNQATGLRLQLDGLAAAVAAASDTSVTRGSAASRDSSSGTDAQEAVAGPMLTASVRKLSSTTALDTCLKAVGAVHFALLQGMNRDIAAATAAFFKEPGVASAESTPTKAAAAAGSTGSDAKGRSKARVFRLGDYQMKQLRNGDVYKGQYQANKKNGEGVYCFINADVYEGEFREDRMDGCGVYTFSHEGRYEGAWQNAVYSGTGAETFAKGSTYHGEYAGGLRNGWGVCRFYNGDYYEGQWARGLRDGMGMQQCTDDSNYVGEYVKGKRHGMGVYSFPNGDTYEGQYQDDLPHGHGVYHFVSGQRYRGMWKQGKKHGWSIYTVDNGAKFIGEWTDGKPSWVKPLPSSADGPPSASADESSAQPSSVNGGEEEGMQRAQQASQHAEQAAVSARSLASAHWSMRGSVQAAVRGAVDQAEASAGAAQAARRRASSLAARLDAAVALLQQQQAGGNAMSHSPLAAM